jgi:hypothetical protein
LDDATRTIDFTVVESREVVARMADRIKSSVDVGGKEVRKRDV